MNSAVLSSSKVVHSVLILWEIEGKTSCVNESDSTLLLFIDSSKHILLVWICLSLQKHELSHLKSLSHGPLNDSSVSRNGNQGLWLSFSLNPLQLPNDVSVLSVKVSALSDWLVVVTLDVVNEDVSMGVSTSDQVGVLLRELTESQTVLSMDLLLWISWVLQCPESQQTWVKLLCAINIVLSIRHSDQIRSQ